MKALITGVSGFVGRYLYSYLISKGVETFGTFNKTKCDLKNCFKLDITDKEECLNLIKKIQPKWIFHLAGFSSVKQSFSFPEKCKQVNVNGTQNLIDAVIETNLDPKILVVSSPEVYGVPKYIPIDEKHPLNPVSPYGESRVEQEKLVLDYVDKFKAHIILVRSFPHTGPGQTPIFVCSEFAKQIAEIEAGKKEPIITVGNLEAERDFLDVRDIIEAYLLAIEKCQPGQLYNICSDKSFKIQAILDKLISFSKMKINIKHDSNKLRPSDIPILVGNSSRFRDLTDWMPKIKFENTLLDLLNYWRNEVK